MARLVSEARAGRIGGDEAIELAHLLGDGAFAAIAGTKKSAGPSGDARAFAMDAARLSFADAAATLLQDPDERVRDAVIRTASADSLDGGIETMWTVAREGGASAAPIWRACGALMLAQGDERAARALENARALNPHDRALWRMLAHAYERDGRARDAEAAALVGAALEASAAGQWKRTAQHLAAALPLVRDPPARAFLLGQLGDALAEQSDWRGAEQRYLQALRLHGAQKNIAAISLESSKIARAQLKQGEFGRACVTLERARAAGASVTAEERKAACDGRPG
jgi:tetratricopeptide (TPR) repeat protein